MTVEGTADAGAGGARRWTFGAVQFDERTFELHVGGQPAGLERKSLEVLRQLLYRAGEVVTKDELLEAVWPGRVLSDNSLPKSISRIREVIGDADQAVIRTVHGYGYRLAAPVTVEHTRSAPALTRLDLKADDRPPLRPLWSLVERLGAGGQGEVWLVRHDKTGEQRVFKFALDLAGLAAIKREITLNRFLRETLAGRDEFTRVLDWNLEELPYYVELEYGGAGNLEDWSAAQGGLARVALADRLEIVARIADALAAAHSVGVLHKDLKPANVLVTPGPGVPGIKLADFGSGSVLDPQRLEALGITRLGFTQSVMQGDAAATAMYLAPEVMSGQPATVQADIYALGILLYQMVVGDLKQPLAQGWERRVGDPLLAEDIALAVAGEPAQRLGDAAALASRLRTLEQRREQRAAEQAELRRLQDEQRAAEARARSAELAVERLRARRRWMTVTLAALIVGSGLSLSLYLEARRARNEADAAAASSRAVADFLSKDMFAQIGDKPLRDLTVPELLQSAATTLATRELSPPVAAQVHGALGGAFLTLEQFEQAQRHLGEARSLLGQAREPITETDVALAAQLLLAEGQTSNPELAPYEDVLARGVRALGRTHPTVLALRHNLAHGQLVWGDWQTAVEQLAEIAQEAGELEPRPHELLASCATLQSMGLIRLARLAEAERVVRQELTEDVAVSQAQQREHAELRKQLAMALAEQGKAREAEAELQRAEALMRSWTASDASAHMAGIWMVQGRARHAAGRHAEAIALLTRAIDSVLAQEWSRTQDYTYELRAWRAAALVASGQPAAAITDLRRAVEASERSLGVDNFMTQDIRSQLALLLAREGKPDEAAAVLGQVDAGALARLGPAHPINRRLAEARALLEAAGAA